MFINGMHKSFDSAGAPLRMTDDAKRCHSERSGAAGETKSKNLSRQLDGIARRG